MELLILVECWSFTLPVHSAEVGRLSILHPQFLGRTALEQPHALRLYLSLHMQLFFFLMLHFSFRGAMFAVL